MQNRKMRDQIEGMENAGLNSRYTFDNWKRYVANPSFLLIHKISTISTSQQKPDSWSFAQHIALQTSICQSTYCFHTRIKIISLEICINVSDTKSNHRSKADRQNLIRMITLVAKRSELSVSAKHSSRGDTFTNISVLLLPPRQFCSRWVSLLLRYGICASCHITSDNHFMHKFSLANKCRYEIKTKPKKSHKNSNITITQCQKNIADCVMVKCEL